MIFSLRIFCLRLRRTARDYKRIWKPDERGRVEHLRRCWRASKGLIIRGNAGKVYEVP